MASDFSLDRRDFFRAAGVAAALSSGGGASASPLTEKEKLDKIASNTWPIRNIFKTRTVPGRSPRNEELKKKYGEITMLDFPQFTKDTFPGVTYMDLFSGLFGDVTDDSMYTQITASAGAPGGGRGPREFDPSSASGKAWLDKMAKKMAATGTKCQHISNNAPRDICDPDVEKRKTGIAVAKKWLDGAAMIGTKSMRINSGGPRIVPSSVALNGTIPRPTSSLRCSATASSLSRRWPTTAERRGSRSRSRITGD